MKKHYWYEQINYQSKLPLLSIAIWVVLGTYMLLDTWTLHRTLLTPFMALPVMMILLAGGRWFIQKKTWYHSPPARRLYHFCGAVFLLTAAFWVYFF